MSSGLSRKGERTEGVGRRIRETDLWDGFLLLVLIEGGLEIGKSLGGCSVVNANLSKPRGQGYAVRCACEGERGVYIYGAFQQDWRPKCHSS